MEQSNGKTLKPQTNYTLSSNEAKIICRWIEELKMQDGYSSNLARCANMKNEKMNEMKIHDRHIFMKCLLPIAFNYLPTHLLNSLVEVSQFFKNLCSSTLRRDDPIKIKNDMLLILYKLEKIFLLNFLFYRAHVSASCTRSQTLKTYPFEREIDQNNFLQHFPLESI